jgi:DNA helicase-4
MVAKAGYALHRKLVAADKILMLAFNADAAAELQARVRERLAPLGFPADGIVARTFHKLGLDIIGQATGKRPGVAPWIDNGQDVEHLSQLIDRLKDRDPAFRTQWDLFQMVFGRDLPSLDQEESEPEDWDRDTKEIGFRTLRNEIVKSHGERLLANWLFYNGVDYRYEQPYEIDLADAQHRQYRPDFYYPAINAYHEHWALDRNGQPPVEFIGYLANMAWKRAKHAEHGTTLLETTSAGLWSGEAFAYLERELTARGIVLDPNPDRPAVGRPPIDHRGLVQLFRTFLVHAKSNRLTNEALQQRLANAPLDRFRYRHQLFLSLFERIRAEWESSLAEARSIDFEDMLVRAADHLERGDWVSPFELVMVDEFQDASQARARLVKALVARPDQRLFAVGDDWQSINRFAGADISVMTGFERWFGQAQIHRLERTFRCPQSLCDVSSRFVQQNPKQLRKAVRSDAPDHSPTVRIVQVADDDRITSAVLTHLRNIHSGVADGSIPRGNNGKVSVMVLGRYNRDRVHLGHWGSLAEHLDVRFHTVHGSKGLEADYVILPRVTSGRSAFPSTRQDDPVMLLAMPDGDDHPHAEERRLFYVALTRARRSVLLITVEHRFSPFIVELVREHQLEVTSVDGTPSQSMVCKCKRGIMVPRNGPYGPFLGCSRFPACENKINRPRNQRSRAPSR